VQPPSVKGRDVIAELGDKEGSMVKVKNGRFGVYINWKRVNAKLPNEYDENPERVPLEEAWSLIQEKEASGTGKASAKSRKAKAPKGQANSGINLPPAPKRSKSAYLLFCDEKRPEVSTTVKKLGDVSKELAKLWALTADVPDARQPYIQMAAEEKAKYATRKLEWQNECQILIDTAAVTGGGATDVLSKTKRSSSSVKKVPHGKKSGIAPAGTPKPKRPKSSYIFFCADQRAEVSENVKSLGEISKELARRWAEAKSTDTHKRFEEMAAVDKHRYELELQKLSSISDLNASKGSGVKQSPRVVPLLKKKRARSAYMIFCGEHRSTIVDDDGVKLPFGETAKKLAQMWRECNEETREKFEAEARKEKDDFMAERY
jgi:phage host-nuclease inhibitor protein Gam